MHRKIKNISVGWIFVKTKFWGIDATNTFDPTALVIKANFKKYLWRHKNISWSALIILTSKCWTLFWWLLAYYIPIIFVLQTRDEGENDSFSKGYNGAGSGFGGGMMSMGGGGGGAADDEESWD